MTVNGSVVAGTKPTPLLEQTVLLVAELFLQLLIKCFIINYTFP